MMRIACAVVVTVLGAAAVARADGADVVLRWNELSVAAVLDADGRLRVSETHDVALTTDVATIDRAIGFAPGQRVEVSGVARLGDGGAAAPLTRGDAERPGEYQAYEETGIVRWSTRSGEGESRPGMVPLRFRVDYVIEGALTPAWDLPAGDAPLDVLKPSWGPLGDRLRQVIAAWREALAAPSVLYRLDQDVLYPTRDAGPGFAFTGRLPYQLDWGASPWELASPGRTVASPEDFRVRRLFAYRGPGAPAAVDRTAAAVRVGALAALPVLGVLLWAGLIASERRRRPVVDRAFFQASALGHSPEMLEALVWRRQQSPPGFVELCERLAREGALAIDELEPGGEDHPPRVRLRLLGTRESLRGWEQQGIDGLFGGAREVTGEQVRERLAKGDTDPDEIVARAFRAALPPPAPSVRPIARILWLALAAAAGWLLVRDLSHGGREPFALFVGAVGALVLPRAIPAPWIVAGGLALSPWLLAPLALFTVVNTLFQLAPNAPLTAEAAAGVSLAFLAGHQLVLAQTLRGRDERGSELERLLWARRWAEGELRRDAPALDDEWIPALRALHLGDAVEAWRARHPEGRAGGFSGVEKVVPRRSDDWAEAFYPG